MKSKAPAKPAKQPAAKPASKKAAPAKPPTKKKTMASAKPATKTPFIEPKGYERKVLLAIYTRQMIAGGYATDLPDSLLPTHLRWQATVRAYTGKLPKPAPKHASNPFPPGNYNILIRKGKSQYYSQVGTTTADKLFRGFTGDRGSVFQHTDSRVLYGLLGDVVEAVASQSPKPAPAPGIALSIFGANLPSKMQQKGQFHVHATDCADCAKVRADAKRYKFPEYKETHATAESVARAIFADQIAEGCSVGEALSEIYFAPCVKFPARISTPAPAPVAPLPPMPTLAQFDAAPAPKPAPMPPPPAPKAQPKPAAKRYQSKTDATSKYHQRDRSTAQSPVAIVRALCEANPGMQRKDIIAMCLARGVNKNTAATQYSLWKSARNKAIAKAGSAQLPLPGVQA